MKNLFWVALILYLFSCNYVEKNTTAVFDIATAKNHILKMNESYSDRFLKNDTAYYYVRYCKDAEVYCPQTPAVKGVDSIIQFFYNNGNNKETKIELPVATIYGNANFVVEEGAYNFPDGKGGSYDKGKFLAIWKLEDGIWKLYREIWNTDIIQKK